MNVKRIAATSILAIQPAIIGALAGMEFSPGNDLAFVYGLGAFIALAVYAGPFWGDMF